MHYYIYCNPFLSHMSLDSNDMHAEAVTHTVILNCFCRLFVGFSQILLNNEMRIQLLSHHKMTLLILWIPSLNANDVKWMTPHTPINTRSPTFPYSVSLAMSSNLYMCIFLIIHSQLSVIMTLPPWLLVLHVHASVLMTLPPWLLVLHVHLIVFINMSCTPKSAAMLTDSPSKPSSCHVTPTGKRNSARLDSCYVPVVVNYTLLP